MTWFEQLFSILLSNTTKASISKLHLRIFGREWGRFFRKRSIILPELLWELSTNIFVKVGVEVMVWRPFWVGGHSVQYSVIGGTELWGSRAYRRHVTKRKREGGWAKNWSAKPTVKSESYLWTSPIQKKMGAGSRVRIRLTCWLHLLAFFSQNTVK